MLAIHSQARLTSPLSGGKWDSGGFPACDVEAIACVVFLAGRSLSQGWRIVMPVETFSGMNSTSTLSQLAPNVRTNKLLILFGC